MKAALWILAAAFAAAAPAPAPAPAPGSDAASADWSVAVDPPPGWEDVSANRRSADIVAAFTGPQGSSFVLTKLNPAGLATPAGRRTLLMDVLSGINRMTGLGFVPNRELKTVTYRNDVTAHFMAASLEAKPRMILAITEYRGRYMLATINSAVPDTLLPSILGTIQYGSGGKDQGLSRRGASADNQMAFALPEGMFLRPPSAREKSEGVVAVVLGFDTVLTLRKVTEVSDSATEEADLVSLILRSVKEVDPRTISRVRTLTTPAGPGLLYAWAEVSSAKAPSQAAAGMLPWGYWGYSVWASGPRARELVEKAMARVKPGPAADAKLLAATPRIASKWSLRSKIITALGILAGAAAALWLLARFVRAIVRRVSHDEVGLSS